MKTSHRCLFPLLGLAIALASTVRAQSAIEAPPAPKEKKELRVIVGHGDAPHAAGIETEPVTFLGVETSRAGGALTTQLGLPQGVGLVVNAIVPTSPAAGALQKHDVLTKLNDQLLVDSGQLGVLVRTFKEGDEVTLTYLRAGKETTSRVKLAKRAAPKMSALRGDHLRELRGKIERGEVDRLLSRLHSDDDAAADDDAPPAPGRVIRKQLREHRPVTTIINKGSSNLVYSDDTGSLELKVDAGKRDIVAKNPQGNVLYAGPATTPEERAKLTPEVRALLEKVENLDGLSFHTDGDFQGGDVKVLVPGAKRISLPLAVPPEHRAESLRSL